MSYINIRCSTEPKTCKRYSLHIVKMSTFNFDLQTFINKNKGKPLLPVRGTLHANLFKSDPSYCKLTVMSKIFDRNVKKRFNMSPGSPASSDDIQSSTELKLMDTKLKNLHSAGIIRPVFRFLSYKRWIKPKTVEQQFTSFSDQDLTKQKLKDQTDRFDVKSCFHGTRSEHISVLRQMLSKLKIDNTSQRKIKLILDAQEIKNRLNKQATSGFPYFVKKEKMLHLVDTIVEQLKGGKLDLEIFTRPAVIYRAPQASEKDLKSRWIYCLPIEITILETIFGGGIVDSFINRSDIPIQMGVSQLNLNKRVLTYKKGKFSTSGDYSKYDTTIPKYLQITSFHILKQLLDLDDYQSIIFDLLVSYNVNCPIYHPVTGFISRKRGLITGSFFTSIINSFCNMYIIESIILNCVNRDDKDLIYLLLGDDSV